MHQSGTHWFKYILHFPRHVVLVRDMCTSLISNFEKWKDYVECTDSSTFIRGDEKGKRFNSDIWWCIRFYNAWGRVLINIPDTTMSIRYEDMMTNTHDVLKNISAFLRLELSDKHLQFGINEASKNKMQKKNDPTALSVVRDDKRNPLDWFSEEDKQFFIAACDNHLNYDSGYNFNDMT